ncbi:GGDEF domain-containing protein [Ferrovum sp. PN-J185]|uniref:GGDEF domain-containing protein n=1 Tax=Ferrovum sp. PN-J185 TaxID=1356306 RepID=UPI001E3D1039|nr:GGDEF domain-containing protein [Ferrovum sp. PN-J185]MCC6068617.1 GGDEF domain-containing protein [Ferrovum sp. PN-J185]
MQIRDTFLIFGVIDIIFSILVYIYVYESKVSVLSIRNIAHSRMLAGIGLLLEYFILTNPLVFQHNILIESVYVLTYTIFCIAIFSATNAFKLCLNKPKISISNFRIVTILLVFWIIIVSTQIKPGYRIGIFSSYYLIMSIVIFLDVSKNWKSISLLQKFMTFFGGYYVIFNITKIVQGYRHPDLKFSDYSNTNLVLLVFLVNFIMYFGFLLLSKEFIDKELITKANTDQLTGLLNRHAFFDIAEKIHAHQNRKERPLSLLYIDIDYFKNVNDQYGHIVGDFILTGFSKILNNTMRKSDFIVRLGGEEFAVLMTDTPPHLAVSVADRFRKEIESNDFITKDSKQVINITTSVGVYGETIVRSSLDNFMNLSDQALYNAKNSGRNKVFEFGK